MLGGAPRGVQSGDTTADDEEPGSDAFGHVTQIKGPDPGRESGRNPDRNTGMKTDIKTDRARLARR